MLGRLVSLSTLLALAACSSGSSSATASASASASAAGAASGPATATASASASAAEGDAPDFSALVASLSEPDGAFFSDNIISNETSYLEVAPALARRAEKDGGGVYIGVGPEQNFSYLALTKPRLAFIVDIRRGNLLEQLLYKALFEEATSRAHFVALLLGRPYDASGDPGANGSLEEILAFVEKRAPDEATFRATEQRALERIARKVKLNAKDKRDIELAHRAFFKGQLEVRFELKEENGRKYPTLRELLATKDPNGEAKGFLADEPSFRFVQAMEKEDRIIPVVGDFAGDRAMPGIAGYLRKQHLSVRTFYTSNVEQYLLEPATWAKWTKNVEAMPIDDESVFIRCYLDQGKKHPREVNGQRTATVLQSIAEFERANAKKPFRDFFALTTDALLPE